MKYFVWIAFIAQLFILTDAAVAQVDSRQQKSSPLMRPSYRLHIDTGSDGASSSKSILVKSQIPSEFKSQSSSPDPAQELFRLRKLIRGEGGVSTGGGDHYVMDFVQTTLNEVYPWTKQNQDFIDADQLILALDPERIRSVDQVFESCQFSESRDGQIQAIRQGPADPEREACYNEDTDFIYLSRHLFPVGLKRNPTKMSLVAHELLRRLRMEGNEHLITGQWSF